MQTNSVIDKVRVNESLSDVEQNIVKQLLTEFSDRFSTNSTDIGYCDVYKHKIDVDSMYPVTVKPFHMSKLHIDLMQEIINDYINAGLIEPSESDWRAPAFLVMKPHLPKNYDIFDKKNYRLVIDYRELNKKTKADVFPIPLLTASLDRLAGRKY
ncbi:polymerase polyprotein-like protein, partial [Leptotrombidium deliense]